MMFRVEYKRIDEGFERNWISWDRLGTFNSSKEAKKAVFNFVLGSDSVNKSLEDFKNFFILEKLPTADAVEEVYRVADQWRNLFSIPIRLKFAPSPWRLGLNDV